MFKASDVSRTLHVQLLKEKADFLLFKVLRVDTAGMFAIWCLVLGFFFLKDDIEDNI